jgi:hypothetical protein
MTMKTRKIVTGLLVALLMMLVIASVVSAKEVQNPDAVAMKELNKVSLDPINRQLPQLQYNETQKPVVVHGEFRITDRTIVGTSAVPASIPYGTIVHHSNDGVTTVFDPTGQQLYVTKDSTAPLINTPGGALPATRVFEVPDKSLIVDDNNITYVFYDNQRILTVLEDSGRKQQRKSSNQDANTPQAGSGYYIEWGITPPISTIQQFSARWTVPKSPVLNITYNTARVDGSASSIWNGLKDINETYVLQPVLEWYWRDNTSVARPDTPNWSISTWWVSLKEYNNNGYHSKRRYGIPSTGELVVSGDSMQGNLYHSGAQWSGAISDLTLGISSTLFLNSSQSSDLTYRNLTASLVLEGWNYPIVPPANYNSSYLPGNITFTNIIINDINGNSAIPSSIIGKINYNTWNITNYSLAVDNTSWSTSLKLNTGNI